MEKHSEDVCTRLHDLMCLCQLIIRRRIIRIIIITTMMRFLSISNTGIIPNTDRVMIPSALFSELQASSCIHRAARVVNESETMHGYDIQAYVS